MAVKITRPPTVRFVQIRNEWARDCRLGLKALGLLVYLHSHREGYELSTAQMVRDHTDGKDAVRTGLEELETHGYLTRVRDRDSGGRWGETDYVLADPFDAEGRIIRRPDAEEERITRQSGFSGADNPARIIRPIEDQWENTNGKTPTPLPPAAAGGGDGQLALVPHHEQGQQQRTPGLAVSATFDEFWAAYPKKVGKDAARRAWGKAVRRADPDKIVAVAREYPWRSERQFVKDPATWLNAGCWEDDLEAVAAANHQPARSASGRTHWELPERGTYTEPENGVFR